MQSLDVTVRQAKEADFQRIVESCGGNESNPFYQFSSIDRIRKLPSFGLLVAEVKEVFAGFLYWIVLDEQRDGVTKKKAHIVRLNVEKRFWKTNVGDSLLGKALKDIDEIKVDSIQVDVPSKNKKLIDLYERIGFSTEERTFHMRYVYTRTGGQAKRSTEEARELMVFLVEVGEQCRAFMTAYSEVTELIAQGPPRNDEERGIFSRRIWSRLQACLASCSIIYKILWPSQLNEKALIRSRGIKQFLELYDKNQFPRHVRNSFEHVDERLSDWLLTQSDEIPWGWCLSSFDKEEEPTDSSQAFRYFHLGTFDLRVADSSCNLREVMHHVNKLLERIPSEAQINFRKRK